MKGIVRRLACGFVLASLAAVLVTGSARADDKVVRIGYQKYGTLVLLKGKGLLEEKLEPLGFTVSWTEFPAGPQLLEALNVGAVDFGSTGEAPPIFAQAAGAPLAYVAHEPPAPAGEAILVPADSEIQSVADLRGKTIALNKGSNVHYLLVRALEQAGVKYEEIETAFLPPADARAAFERGAVDAWVIWDPFQAAAEVAIGARTLVDGSGLVANHQFYLGEKSFTQTNPEVIDAIIESIAEVDDWVKSDPEAAAEELSPSIGIPASVLVIALQRQSYGVKRLDDDVVAEQQRIADTFHELGLLPAPITIREAVARPAS